MDDSAQKDAEEARKEQEAQEKANLQDVEQKRTKAMRSRFTGGMLAGSSTSSTLG
jgi:hypothetical protein